MDGVVNPVPGKAPVYDAFSRQRQSVGMFTLRTILQNSRSVDVAFRGIRARSEKVLPSAVEQRTGCQENNSRSAGYEPIQGTQERGMKTGTTPNYPTDQPQAPAKPTKLTPRSNQFADPTPHAKFEFWGLEFCYSKPRNSANARSCKCFC
jgi:hypothetical protein